MQSPDTVPGSAQVRVGLVTAVGKIDDGTFGTCEVCGEPIEFKRLEARPVTTHCIGCKTEEEEEEKIRKL